MAYGLYFYSLHIKYLEIRVGIIKCYRNWSVYFHFYIDIACRCVVQVIMLERLVEQRNAVTLVLADVPSLKNLTAQQWATAADLTVTLRPFMDVTEMLCGATYPTLSMIIPVLDGLQHLLQSTDGGLDVLRALLLRLLADKFGDVFGDDELCVATIVDPRFKIIAFDGDNRRQRAKQLTLQYMEQYATAVINAGVETPAAESSATATQVQSQKASIWDKFDNAAR